MADGKPTVHSMLKDAITNLGGTVTHRQIIDWINGKYNDVNERTIRAHIEMASVNMRGRVGMPQNSKPREHDERYDLLFSIGKGEVELYNPTKHGKWSLMETRNGKTVIAKDGVPSEGDTDSYRHLQNSEFEKIKRFCLEELPSPDRNYREIALKKLLDNENFVVTKDVIGECVKKLNPEGNPAYEEPKVKYKRAACEMIGEYLVKPTRQGLVPIVKDQGDSYSLILSTSTKEEQVNELKSICGKAIANRHVTELMKEDNQYWFIQAGRKNEQKIQLEKFRKGGYVAVDYYEDCDFDLSDMTRNEIDTKTGGEKVQELVNIEQIKQGDFIAVVKGNKTVEEFAIATSDYYFVVSDTERDKHRVNVEYLNFGTTKFGKNWNAAIMQDTSGKIKNFLLGEKEPKYFLLRHNVKGPWKDDPGKKYHLGIQSDGKMGKRVGPILDAGIGTKTVWCTTSKGKFYFWGYGTVTGIEEEKKDTDWYLTYNDFKFFEGDTNIQGRKLKPATESVNQQLQELQGDKEWKMNWQFPINPIPKKIYEEITGDRSTMVTSEKQDTAKLERLYQILERKKQIILYGPPGTGKTYYANQLRDYILSKNAEIASTKIEHDNPDDYDDETILPSFNFFMINGPWAHLKHSLDNEPFLWATKGSSASDIGIYNKLQTNDIIFFSNSTKDPGPFQKKVVFGFGRLVRKFEGTEPYWPDEVKENKVIYKYRLETKIEFITYEPSKAIEWIEGLPYTKGFNSVVNEDVIRKLIAKIDRQWADSKDGNRAIHEIKHDVELRPRSIIGTDSFSKNITLHESYSYEDFVEGIRFIFL